MLFVTNLSIVLVIAKELSVLTDGLPGFFHQFQQERVLWMDIRRVPKPSWLRKR